MQAVELTFGTLVALLLAYRSGLIKATDNLRLGVVAATGGIALFIYRNHDMGSLAYVSRQRLGWGFWGIGISVFIVIVAALNWCWIST
jgi:uncharacterized YccA/Bax inhibitor family protein